MGSLYFADCMRVRVGQTGGTQADKNLPLFIRKHPLMLPQEANIGLRENLFKFGGVSK